MEADLNLNVDHSTPTPTPPRDASSNPEASRDTDAFQAQLGTNAPRLGANFPPDPHGGNPAHAGSGPRELIGTNVLDMSRQQPPIQPPIQPRIQVSAQAAAARLAAQQALNNVPVLHQNLVAATAHLDRRQAASQIWIQHHISIPPSQIQFIRDVTSQSRS
jgi:hypothetical protein